MVCPTAIHRCELEYPQVCKKDMDKLIMNYFVVEGKTPCPPLPPHPRTTSPLLQSLLLGEKSGGFLLHPPPFLLEFWSVFTARMTADRGVIILAQDTRTPQSILRTSQTQVPPLCLIAPAKQGTHTHTRGSY